MATKKASKKEGKKKIIKTGSKPAAAKVSKPTAPELCLRQIDQNTQLMSDDPQFPVVRKTSDVVPEGFVRIDKYTVIPV